MLPLLLQTMKKGETGLLLVQSPEPTHLRIEAKGPAEK
jgi:hypothetical protein